MGYLVCNTIGATGSIIKIITLNDTDCSVLVQRASIFNYDSVVFILMDAFELQKRVLYDLLEPKLIVRNISQAIIHSKNLEPYIPFLNNLIL